MNVLYGEVRAWSIYISAAAMAQQDMKTVKAMFVDPYLDTKMSE